MKKKEAQAYSPKKEYLKLATAVTSITLAAILSGCEGSPLSSPKHKAGSTLLLTQAGIIEKDLLPSKDFKLSNTHIKTETQPTEPKKQDATPDNDTLNNKGQDKNQEQPQQSITKQRQTPPKRLISVGNTQVRGYSNLEVYTEIPVPVQYSAPQIITSGNGYNQGVFVPATPTKIERVRIGPNSRISGFIDYGPTVNIPIRNGNNVYYIRQKSPMPMPIIDRVSITHQ